MRFRTPGRANARAPRGRLTGYRERARMIAAAMVVLALVVFAALLGFITVCDRV